MFEFEYIGTISDVEITKMNDNLSGKSYLKFTRLQNGNPSKQSIILPFNQTQKLIDLLNDANLYASGDVGYSESAPAGFISTDSGVHATLKASLSTDADPLVDQAFIRHWENRLNMQQVRNEFEISKGHAFSWDLPDCVQWFKDYVEVLSHSL